MCGEIGPNQTAHTASIRLTVSADHYKVKLPKQFQRVEEIRLDEYMVINFNGGVSGVGYLNVNVNGSQAFAINNDNKNGTALGVDVLNPQVIYNRPRILASGDGVAITDFEVRFDMADGTLATFTEALFVVTFVMRKPAEEIAAYRRVAAMQEIPAMKGVDPRTTYHPSRK